MLKQILEFQQFPLITTFSNCDVVLIYDIFLSNFYVICVRYHINFFFYYCRKFNSLHIIRKLSPDIHLQTYIWKWALNFFLIMHLSYRHEVKLYHPPSRNPWSDTECILVQICAESANTLSRYLIAWWMWWAFVQKYICKYVYTYVCILLSLFLYSSPSTVLDENTYDFKCTYIFAKFCMNSIELNYFCISPSWCF